MSDKISAVEIAQMRHREFEKEKKKRLKDNSGRPVLILVRDRVTSHKPQVTDH